MPLSEHEQRLLEQMEQQLSVEDPKFASAMRGSVARAKARRRIIFGSLGVILGLGLVLLGVARGAVVVGIVGFALMVAGRLAGHHARAAQGPGRGGRGGRHHPAARRPGRPGTQGSARPQEPPVRWHPRHVHAAHGAALGPPSRRQLGRLKRGPAQPVTTATSHSSPMATPADSSISALHPAAAAACRVDRLARSWLPSRASSAR